MEIFSENSQKQKVLLANSLGAGDGFIQPIFYKRFATSVCKSDKMHQKIVVGCDVVTGRITLATKLKMPIFTHNLQSRVLVFQNFI